jgi:hypothetical protein
MSISIHKRFFAFFLILISCQLQAIDFQKYAKHNRVQEANETSRRTLLGIIGSCGNATHLDDDCMVQGLERVAQEENNAQAKAISNDYDKALMEGNFSKPECQTESHLQANRTIGHCILLLNNYMLEDYEKNDAILQYEMCLQGGMMGLAYQGNLAAQYMLSEIYREKNQAEQGAVWTEYLKTKKNTDEYDILMRCYDSHFYL